MATMRTIGVRLRMDVGDYKRDAEEAARATRRVGDSGVKAKADLDDLAMGLGVVGAGLVAVAGVAVYAGATFDKQMSEVGAVANATAGEMDQLRQAALDAGAATVFSATEAAQAEAELAKAGIRTADILGGALTGALSLASAGSLDLATSAEIAAAAMNTFGLGGRDVEHIADVLAAAANKSAAGVEDLGQGLQQVGLIANQVGFSLEETVALLAAFADRGLKGSDGATSLKTALMRLAAPTGDAAKLLKELDISLYDSNGQMVDAVTVAAQLERGLKDLSPAQRNAALNTIFGSDAIRAANVIYGEGAAGIRDYIAAVNDQGAAARVAAAKLDNLVGDVEALKGSLETTFIESSGGATGGLRVLARSATDVVNAFGQLPEPVSQAGTVLAGVTGLALLGTAGAVKFSRAIDGAVESLTGLGPAGATAGRGLRTVATGATAAGAALAGALIIGQATAAMVGELNPQMEALGKGLNEWATTGHLGAEATRVLGKDFESLDKAVSALGSNPTWATGLARSTSMFGGSSWISALGMELDRAAEQIKAADSALAQLVQGGEGQAAAEVWARIAAQAQTAGVSVERLKELFPEYAGALEVAGTAAQDQAAAAEAAAKANAELAGQFGIAASEAGGLIAAFDTLNGKTLHWREAEREAEAAVDDLAKALDESNGSLDVHDEKGRAAAAAADELARKGVEAAQAILDQTGNVEEAERVYEKYRDELRKQLKQAGLSKKAIDDLINSIMSMPSSKTTTIKVKTSLDLSTLPDFVRSSLGMRWGGITVRAQDGVLREAGVYSPSGPARYAFAEPATGGEAFVPKNGNYGRSMQILSEAAGWYGAQVVPQGGWYGGGTHTVVVDSIIRNEDGRKIHEKLTSFAINTGRTPAALWPDRRR